MAKPPPEKKQYTGVVDIVPKHPNGDLMGHVYVLVDNIQRHAYLPSSFKSIKQGDTVTLEKTSMWKVTAVHTYHAPPKVTVSMGTPPPSATTVSGSPASVSGAGLYEIPIPPSAPTSGVGTTLAQLQVWATNTRAYLQDLSQWTQQVRMRHGQAIDRIAELQSALNTNSTRLSSAQSALNANATKLNQAVDYAGGAADAIAPVVDALKNEHIVK